MSEVIRLKRIYQGRLKNHGRIQTKLKINNKTRERNEIVNHINKK